MRKVFFFCFFISVAASAETQMPSWTPIRIPMDSLNPCNLTFIDSLHGYFGAFKVRNHGIFWNDFQFFWFMTSDGGKSWNKLIHKIDGSILPDSGSYWIDGTIGDDYFSPILYPSVSTQYIYGWDKDSISLTSTSDGGATWIKASHTPYLHLFSALSENHLLAYHHGNKHLYESYDLGKTFKEMKADSAYLNTADPIFPLDTSGADSPTFDFSDSNNWTIAWSYAYEQYRVSMPVGLHTLVSTNSGHSWESHDAQFHGIDHPSGTLEYIRNTPYLYYFTGQSQGAGSQSSNSIGNSGDAAFPTFGISFLSSTDYGRTWTSNNSYGDKRRAFKAIQKDEIWITATSDSAVWAFGKTPAYKICHTTDNGSTWQEDSMSLRIESSKLDGRLMTFSDPRHGWIAAWDWPHTYIFRSFENANDVKPTQASYVFSVYPNPTENSITVETSSPLKIELFDLLGRSVLKYLPSAEKVTLNVSEIPDGSYILRMESSGAVQNKSIVIVH